jgi:hypothetical protein
MVRGYFTSTPCICILFLGKILYGIYGDYLIEYSPDSCNFVPSGLISEGDG